MPLDEIKDIARVKRRVAENLEGWGVLPSYLLPSIIGTDSWYALPQTVRSTSDGARDVGMERLRIEGGYAVKSRSNVAGLATFVREEMLANSGGVFVIENVLARPGDRYLDGVPCRVLYEGDAVLHLADSSTSLQALHECILRSRFTFGHSLAVITKGESELFDKARELAGVTAEQLAVAASWIIVAPSDDEIFLVRLR